MSPARYSLTVQHCGLKHHSFFVILQIPIAWLSLFDVICIIVLLPLFDRAIYPALDRRGYTPPLRSRIMVGMVFSGIAVVVAGFLEMYRLHVYLKGHVHNQTIGEIIVLGVFFYPLPNPKNIIWRGGGELKWFLSASASTSIAQRFISQMVLNRIFKH